MIMSARINPMVVVIRWQRCILLLFFVFGLPTASSSSLLLFAFCSPLQQKSSEQTSKVHHHMKHDNNDDDTSFGLYVHIPYCRRRCNYCDFAITPIGANHDNDETRADGFRKLDAKYKNAVLNEIDVIQSTCNHPQETIRLRSIYFGGGTPSLAPLSTLQAILDKIVNSEDSIFILNEDAEITIEMDPGTFDLPYLIAIKEMGFNRISLGVQSFDDDILSTMGRVHRSVDVYSSIEMIQQIYGEYANYSIDLIFGVPGLTLAGWTDTLYKAVRLRPRPMHLSLYDLQLEKGTSFGKWYKNAVDMDDARDVLFDKSSSAHPTLPSVEDCAFMYCFASGYLRSKNYDHYEISSYAYTTPDGTLHRSKHNSNYWGYGAQWYAVGMGSTSNINGVRFARPRALSDYVLWTEDLKKDRSKLPPWLYKDTDGELEDTGDDLLDVIMTRLRTSEGLNLDWVAHHDNYGETHVKEILRGFQLALDLGLGHRIDGRNGTYGFIKLSDPKGFLFSNNIISNIFLSLSEM